MLLFFGRRIVLEQIKFKQFCGSTLGTVDSILQQKFLAKYDEESSVMAFIK